MADYYTPSGKYLGTWGRGQGSATAVRGILESDYDTLAREAWKAAERSRTGDGIDRCDYHGTRSWERPRVVANSQDMFNASKQIAVQADQRVFLEGLFADARSTHGEEQGAYLVYSFKDGSLRLIRARNRELTAEDRKVRFKWDLGVDKSGRVVMPTDDTQVVIGTIHTHWDDQKREVPEVSPRWDVPSAKDKRFVVFALDRNHLHRADPDGSAHNRLPRNLDDVLSPAMRIYGNTFTP
jgi:hypothetical protein